MKIDWLSVVAIAAIIGIAAQAIHEDYRESMSAIACVEAGGSWKDGSCERGSK